MNDPFRIDGPALISFSGGRSSAYMLHHILRAHGGVLPTDIQVVFANTGKEMAATLTFVHHCGLHWDVPIVWLEYRAAERPQDRWVVVNHETASRAGEPFDQLIETKRYLPNPVTRMCSQELKINLIQRWARANDMVGADRVIGFRADEAHRLARVRDREETGKDAWGVVAPMIAAGTTKAHVVAFWKASNFDLGLPSINGSTPHGNCDLCFLKSAATISGMMRDIPGVADWWISAETRIKASKPLGARFRSDRPSYAEMQAAVRDQRVFDFGDADQLIDCYCGEPT